MKKSTKILLPLVCVLVVVLVVVSVAKLYPGEPKETVCFHGDTAINTDDPREVVGAKSYVFVGYVEDTHDYYSSKASRAFPQIVRDYEMSFTECEVTVIKNIKGNLNENQRFSFYKVGGLSEDGKLIELYENDLMPQKGKYYIFTGIAHEDGTITGGGENGTIELESTITSENLSDSVIYNTYVSAYNKQIINESATAAAYLAKNDKNYSADNVRNP